MTELGCDMKNKAGRDMVKMYDSPIPWPLRMFLLFPDFFHCLSGPVAAAENSKSPTFQASRQTRALSVNGVRRLGVGEWEGFPSKGSIYRGKCDESALKWMM